MSNSTITGNTSKTVERHLGNSYKTVVEVSKNLKEIKQLGSVAEHIVVTGSNIEAIKTVATNIGDVNNVSDNMEYVKDVAAGIEGLPVHGYIGNTPPLQPLQGAEWYCTLDGRTYVWYIDDDSGQWVESSPQSDVTDLSANNGASKIGTSDGYTVQEKLDQVNTTVWNRKVVEAAINNTFVTYVDEGRTLTPRLSFEGYHYLPLFDATTPVSFTGLPTKNGDGTITVATDKGNRQFSRVIAEAINQESKIIVSGSTTGRKIVDRFADVINVKDFGAVGDGVADDTYAIQSALNSQANTVIIPDGVFRVTSGLIDGKQNRTIQMIGSFSAYTGQSPVLTLAAGSSLKYPNINGNMMSAVGIDASAGMCSVYGGVIENLKTETTGCVGVVANTTLGVSINGVQIRGLRSASNTVVGAGGIVRAIQVWNADAATTQSVICDNIITDVQGFEGDAIHVMFQRDGTFPFKDGMAVVSGNKINNFSRRGIKIQANGCVIKDNIVINKLRKSDGFPNITSGINVIVGSNNIVKSNIVDNRDGGGIAIQGSAGSGCSNNFVVSNTVTAYDTYVPVYWELCDNFVAVDNITTGGTGCVKGGNGRSPTIMRNTAIQSSGNASVYATSTATDALIMSNVNVGGTAIAGVRSDGSGSVIKDNVNVGDGHGITLPSSATNALVVGNVSTDPTKNTVDSAVSSDLKASNNVTTKSSAIYGAVYHFRAAPTTDTHPETKWARGDVVFNTNPSGNIIGWICSTAGIGDNSVWKPITV